MSYNTISYSRPRGAVMIPKSASQAWISSYDNHLSSAYGSADGGQYFVDQNKQKHNLQHQAFADRHQATTFAANQRGDYVSGWSSSVRVE